MATISYADLEKRNNIEVFVDRLNGGGFQLKDDKSPVMKANGNATIKQGRNTIKFSKNNPLTADTLRTFLKTKAGADYLMIELNKKMYRVSALFKDKDFGGVAGKSTGAGSERQELGLIDAINQAALHGQAVIDQISPLVNIKGAAKNDGLSDVGQEPYIDVHIMSDKKTYGISCKGTSAPSLAGGGVAGMKVVVPDLLPKLYQTVEKELRAAGYKQGDKVSADVVPDYFIEIPASYVESILKGNKKMGGPIDYMYVGPMDVKASTVGKKLKLNGNFYSIKDYMKKIGKFYFRIRKRDLDPDNMIVVEYNKKSREGFPLLMVSPSKGKNNMRIVVTDKVPSTGKVLKLV